MSERIAFIGFGEAGQTISRGLLAEGTREIRAYDILFDDPADAGRLKHMAEDCGVAAAGNHIDAVRGADLVFLAVTASSSLDAAESCLPGLRAGQLFLDINSVSPQRKLDTAARVAPTGAAYVDVAVMAAVAPYAHKVPMLIGGPGAAELLPRARALGMKAEFVSDRVGQASAVKMFRSIMIKGLEALMLESMLAASEYGVEARVLASLKETFPSIDWEHMSGYMIERTVTHGRRRAAEMREVAATLQDIGIEPLMAAAAARREQWLADLEIGKRLARKTEDRDTLVQAIRAAIGKPAPADAPRKVSAGPAAR